MTKDFTCEKQSPTAEISTPTFAPIYSCIEPHITEKI